MTPPSVILCNYTESEVKAWRFLLRQFPLLKITVVAPNQFGCTLRELVERPQDSTSGEAPAFTGRLAVFAGATGELLSLLVDLSRQASREKAHRATMTDTNAQWTVNYLYRQMEQEERQLMGRRKK